MAHLIRIGNSQGIRIPKPLIELAQLEGKELQLRLVEGGLLISPEARVREGLAKCYRTDDSGPWSRAAGRGLAGPAAGI